MRQEPIVRGQHADEEEHRADQDAGKEVFFLLPGQCGQDERSQEVDEQRERKHDACEKRQFEPDDEDIHDARGDHVFGDQRINRHERLFQQPHQVHDEIERGRHPDDQRDEHLQQRPAQILHVVEERLHDIAVGLLAEVEKGLQQLVDPRHGRGRCRVWAEGQSGKFRPNAGLNFPERGRIEHPRRRGPCPSIAPFARRKLAGSKSRGRHWSARRSSVQEGPSI